MNKILDKIPPILKNKFIVTSIIFVLWVTFFDQYNLIDRFKSIRELDKLEDDMVYYREKITEDSVKLYQLETNNDNLERFAREQFLMKKDNEDVFIIEEE